MINDSLSLNNDTIVFNKNNKDSEKWVIYYIYAKIKDDFKAIYIGITSQLSYIKLACNEYIINNFSCGRFTKHKRDLALNKHDNYFLQDLYNKGVEFFYCIDTSNIYRNKKDAKQVENIKIRNQELTSYLLNINGLTLKQLENKKIFYTSVILEKVLNKKTFSFFVKKYLTFKKISL